MSEERAYDIAREALGIDWWNTESAARRVAEHAADRIEELEAQLAKAVAQLEETNSVLTQTVGQRRHKAWATIRKTNNTLVELTGDKE